MSTGNIYAFSLLFCYVIFRSFISVRKNLRQVKYEFQLRPFKWQANCSFLKTVHKL